MFNKLGHHYSQERIIALWEDVMPTVTKQRPPEPLVMRFNTFDCGKLLHANLVPAEYELDDFQVRTPTDIIGQHIHLPKWDLTTRTKMLDYAEKHGIDVPVTVKKPYSMDANMLHISYEGGVLEDPWNEPDKEMFRWTTAPEDAPDDRVVFRNVVGRAQGPVPPARS